MKKQNIGKLKPKEWQSLMEAWNNYGHSIPFDKLIDIKTGTSRGSLSYVALAWDVGEGMVEYADLYTVDRGQTWEFCNDSCGPVSREVWDKAKQIPECDSLDIEYAD